MGIYIIWVATSLYFYYLSKGVLSQVQVLTKEEEQRLNRKENDYAITHAFWQADFYHYSCYNFNVFGLAINLQNQAFIILMILILGFLF